MENRRIIAVDDMLYKAKGSERNRIEWRLQSLIGFETGIPI